ncbi:universal stress protein [Lentilactobacillus senioris]|uniref:universal stress protein n=1 Tax=Lentilactobacillus senioris TaxID=931534 RepID=UPI00227DCA49|nr:universal stress protein [Lentilactobacillus senioris]MCY9806283.1 universal stress protein [Lentilactobacillus senioris]
MYNKILVPVDGSHNANLALDHALTLAEKFDSEVMIISAIDTRRISQYGFIEAHTNVLMDQIVEPMHEAAKRHVESAADAAKQRGIKYTTLIVKGDPKTLIANDLSDEYDIDLIVMGKSGVDAITRITIGSTTAYVARHATHNLLIISDDDAEES